MNKQAHRAIRDKQHLTVAVPILPNIASETPQQKSKQSTMLSKEQKQWLDRNNYNKVYQRRLLKEKVGKEKGASMA